jgi:F-type H+-transporting ATPase subunit gamma
VEPDKETILKELIPIVIRLTLYNALLESHTSEHAARSIAMQTATDNADDMLEDLSLLYNKSRQESITNELLDIIGASFK